MTKRNEIENCMNNSNAAFTSTHDTGSESPIALTGNPYTKHFSLLFFCQFKKNMHICSALHLIQASRFANTIAAGFFYAPGYTYSSVPCGALMRPLPESGVMQRGAELFLFPSFI